MKKLLKILLIPALFILSTTAVYARQFESDRIVNFPDGDFNLRQVIIDRNNFSFIMEEHPVTGIALNLDALQISLLRGTSWEDFETELLPFLTEFPWRASRVPEGLLIEVTLDEPLSLVGVSAITFTAWSAPFPPGAVALPRDIVWLGQSTIILNEAVRDMFEWEPWDPLDGREFDTALEALYFMQFGEAYEYITEHIAPINQVTEIHGMEFEILSAIGQGGIWQDSTSANTNVFAVLRGFEGEAAAHQEPGLQFDANNLPGHVVHPRIIDEDNVYFVINIWGGFLEEDADEKEIDIDMEFTYMFLGRSFDMEEIALDAPRILVGNRGDFETVDRNNVIMWQHFAGGGIWDFDEEGNMIELEPPLWEMSPDEGLARFGALVQDQMEMYLASGVYLTNIALNSELDLLHIQTRHEEVMAFEWMNIFLTEAPPDPFSWGEWIPVVYGLVFAEMGEMPEVITEDGVSVILRPTPLNNIRHSEMVFYVGNVDIRNLVLEIARDNFEELIELDATVSFTAPVIITDFFIEDLSAKAEIIGQEVVIISLSYNLRGANIGLELSEESAEIIQEFFFDNPMIGFPDVESAVFDAIEIVLIYPDGEVTAELSWAWFSPPWEWISEPDGEEVSVPANLSVDVPLNSLELIGIRFNGVEIRF